MKQDLKYRMYGLVNYQLSGIQKGIQFGHAVVEYGLANFKLEEYQKWARYDKTFIILNGGTTNVSNIDYGTLNAHKDTLDYNGIVFAPFYEPDLGDQLTAVVFLVDERVWDKQKYPDYDGPLYLDDSPIEKNYYEWKMMFCETEKEADKIIFLREFLKQFRFA